MPRPPMTQRALQPQRPEFSRLHDTLTNASTLTAKKSNYVNTTLRLVGTSVHKDGLPTPDAVMTSSDMTV